MKQTIMVVDDEIDNVEALERLFRRKYKVLKATSGKEALKILKTEDVSLIISDQRMPEMTGIEFLKKSISTHPETIRILLTGYTDVESIVGAINSGEVYRYLNKPWDPVDLSNTVEKAVEKFDLRRNLKQKNIELAAALEELKTLDEAKSHFMVLINHELKTPLTVLLSYLELMLESGANEEQKTYTDRMQKAANRLRNIIEDVLQLVSAETGVMKLSIKKTSTDKIMGQVNPEVLAKAGAKEQKIVDDLGKLSVKIDGKVIGSVLTRILENAVKFGDKESDIVLAATEKDDQVFISVSNKGKAIPAKMVDKILKPFTLDENIMNHSEGMGLGLSLCQALLRHHGSELSIKNTKDKVEVGFLV